MTVVDVAEGSGPLVLGVPHAGLEVPEAVFARLNANGQSLRDADWRVDQLYDGLAPTATMVRARFHRYVVDANRAPDRASLYPGQNTTSLVPVTDFDGQPIWRDGQAPSEAEIDERLERFHQPYHAALRAAVEGALERHGVAVLYDCHSIRSECPFLFEGRLPDFNIGDNGGVTCSPVATEAVVAICADAEDYTHVLNGRFRGGWTTRHYGAPERGVHAIQMELAQATHLDTEAPPFDYAAAKADRLRAPLAAILTRLDRLARDGALTAT